MNLERTLTRANAPWLLLALLGCNLNVELECGSPSDCTDPARRTCEQVRDEPCQVGASATKTRCVSSSGCKCRVGYDPETYTTVPGRISGFSCADPVRDSGYHGPPIECAESIHCPKENSACVQTGSSECALGQTPNGAGCSALDTPGCYCLVGDGPDAGGFYYNPGAIVGQHCVGPTDADAGPGD